MMAVHGRLTTGRQSELTKWYHFLRVGWEGKIGDKAGRVI